MKGRFYWKGHYQQRKAEPVLIDRLRTVARAEAYGDALTPMALNDGGDQRHLTSAQGYVDLGMLEELTQSLRRSNLSAGARRKC